MRGLICSSLLLLLSACGEPEPGVDSAPAADDSGDAPPGCFAADPALDVGTGSNGFEALESGDPLVMVHGPQGGWHMLGSVRTHNMEPIVRIQFVVTVASSGAEVANNSLYVQTITDPDDPCVGVYPGMYAYLNVADLVDGDDDTPPELLGYETLVFTAVVTDDNSVPPAPERVVRASVSVTATPDPIDLEDDPDMATPGR